MVLKGFPNIITYGQHYNFGEKPTVILYTDINHHVGTSKQKHTNTTRYEFRITIYMDRELSTTTVN